MGPLRRLSRPGLHRGTPRTLLTSHTPNGAVEHHPLAPSSGRARNRPRPAHRPSALRTPRLLRTEVLAGLVVALALIPEAISFSIIAGVDPRVGLFASFTMAVTIAIVGGRPAMISAATGAVALVIAPLVREHGLDYLIAAVHPRPASSRSCSALARRGRADALHPAQRHGRLRQRAGDPDLHGPGPAPDRRAVAGLPAGRRRAGDHGRAAAADHGGPGAAGRDRRAHRGHGGRRRSTCRPSATRASCRTSLPIARPAATCRSPWTR